MDTRIQMILLIAASTFAGAFYFSTRLVSAAAPLRLLDRPNTRSLHQQPTPRTGGLALLAGMAIGILLMTFATVALPVRTMGFILAGLTPLIWVSFLDDYRGVAARWRILIHSLGAVSLLAAGLAPERLELPGLSVPLPQGIAIALTWLYVVWMTNLYNFMDGMDGFAGGMAVVGFLALAVMGWADAGFALFCVIIAAASAGFLAHNFPPARIFLGDTGSTTLGFLAAACSLWSDRAGLFPLWAALLVFSPFIVDATVTLVRRLLRGEKVWEAHRSHCYQRLVLLGWGHRRTVLVEYALMLACAGSAFWAIRQPLGGQLALAVVWLSIYSALIWGVGWLERRQATLSTA